MPTKTKAKPEGVLAKHRDRMKNDDEYRDAALTAPIGVRGKFLTTTAPNAMTATDTKANKTEASKAQRDGHAIADDTLAAQA